MKILELLNREENLIVGYWTEGHYCSQNFAHKCNKYFSPDLTSEFFVLPHQVTQGWILKHEHSHFEYWLEPCSEYERNAIAATYFFYDFD